MTNLALTGISVGVPWRPVKDLCSPRPIPTFTVVSALLSTCLEEIRSIRYMGIQAQKRRERPRPEVAELD